MLQLKDIRKAYTTAAFTQVALDDVCVSFRDNEFAAILGPSGSGKTTLLNILGGLDHADSGDIVINGVSTKDYSDRDWDAYRNHRIGFIFQSYNLIPHQSVLSNVELALTLAGLPTGVRRERALAALGQVGLAEHADKRPSQLSGGQMQRVAIARALVNDPDIVLADEPTGALDTDTGIQVMELLKDIARDRLVVMVTHNPELAEQYATRIIRLRDGRIEGDTDPLLTDGRQDDAAAGPLHLAGQTAAQPQHGRHRAQKPLPVGASVSDATRHASMSFLTALALSFNNLMTKKGRTFMTAFAGSIGIIGIAAILALSNGVNDYIARTEEEALSSYPLTITKSSFDLSGLIMANMGVDEEGEGQGESERLIPQTTVMADMFAQVKNNDLKSFRAFLEGGESGIEPYVNSIQYTYGVTPHIYKADTSDGIVLLNPSRVGKTLSSGFSGSAFLGGSSMSSFTELLDDRRLLEQSLELVEGRWPETYDECVVVLGRDGGITDFTLYSLGVYDTRVMDELTTKALNGETVDPPETEGTFTRDDALALHFAVVPACDLYRRNIEQGTWTDMTGDKQYMRQAIADAVDLHVVGIVKQSDGAGSSGVPEGIAYTSALTRHLMDAAEGSAIVSSQRDNPEVDVFTGKTFEELRDDESRSFDFESMFTVDEEALRQAFSFDSSALDGLGGDLDFSGMDLDLGSSMEGLDLSGMQLDTSQMASVFSEDTMRQIMEGAPQFSLGDTGMTMTTPTGDSLTDEQRKALNDAVQALGTDFVNWIAAHPELLSQEGEGQDQQGDDQQGQDDSKKTDDQQGQDDSKKTEDQQDDGQDQQQDTPDYASLLEQYLQTESAQAILAPVIQQMGEQLGLQLQRQVSAAMNDYLSRQLVPYLLQSIAGLTPEQLANGLDQNTVAQIMAGAPQFSLEGLNLGQSGPTLTDEQRATLNETADKLASDFTAWLMQHPELLANEEGQQVDYAKLMEQYLQTESAQAIISPITEQLGQQVGAEMEARIGGAMNDYLTNQFAPYISQQMGTLMEQAAQALAQQLATAVTEQLTAQMALVSGRIGTQLGSAISTQMQGQMEQISSAMEDGFKVDTDAFARAIQFNMTQEDLTSLLNNYMNADELTYEGNMAKLGYATIDSPESISIYPKDFEAKEAVLDIVDDYNRRAEADGRDDEAIQYSDIAGVLMSSVTDIVNTVSLVLIAFVSISLVVSSIMISIITYISVLERKKEIGILRAMGASKLNVANIFNAETVIEGFFAGLLAVLVVYAASVPVNAIVLELKNVPDIMQLPLSSAAGLVAISVVLTLVAGLIPSTAAARRDPVEALRSE